MRTYYLITSNSQRIWAITDDLVIVSSSEISILEWNLRDLIWYCMFKGYALEKKLVLQCKE